jgi:NADPH-dependent curcumin reductase CurA
MQGFLVFDYVKQYGDALQEMAAWRNEGTLKTREEIVDGSIEDFQPTLMKLFAGENTGKLVLQIAQP